MALITTISGIPLFSTWNEASTWATANKLNGYHTHKFQGRIGYMGGTNHPQTITLPIPSVRQVETDTQETAIEPVRRVNPNIPTPQVQQQIQPQTRTQTARQEDPIVPRRGRISGGSGGGGGGGGY